MNITLKRTELTDLKIDLTNIHLRDPTCLGSANSESTILIQSAIKDRACGTTINVNTTHAIYQNDVYLPPDPSGLIYREDYIINAACAYPRDMNVSLGTALNPIISTIYITLQGFGRFQVKMALFKDPLYSIPREQGDELTTRDMLYVGVFIAEGDTTRFHLVMKNCFATPIDNFYNTLRYYMIRKSCKNERDSTIEVPANGIASYGQFSVQAFKFVGGYGQIYLHCEVHLCDRLAGSCLPVCPPEGDDSDDGDGSHLGLGGITIKDPTDICTDLQCGPSYINVTFQKNDLIDSNINIPNLSLNEKNCHDLYDSGKNLTIGWPLGEGECGTILKTNGTHAIYSNAIYLGPNPAQIIYREEYFINVSCIYPLDMNMSLANALNPIISTIYITLEGAGKFIVKMALFKDPLYSIPREQGDELTTKDILYIGVIIAEGDTNRFHLVMKNCFATPIDNFYNTLKYYIIRKSCKNERDSTIQVPANGIASYGQFSVQAFKFVGGYGQIYLHCEVHLCDRLAGSCLPVCPAEDDDSDDDDYFYLGMGGVTIKYPTDLCSELHCGPSYINVTFSKKDLINSNIDIPNLSLNEKKCHDLYDNGTNLTIGWPLGEGKCGTSLKTNATHAVYSNAIYLGPNQSQIIYREEYFINVSCIYPLDMNLSLPNGLIPFVNKTNIFIEGYGRFEVKMVAYKDSGYLHPFETGMVSISTNDRLHVGVFISNGDTNQFNIVLRKCYATPTSNADNLPQYPLILNSCPNDEDGTVDIPANGVSSQSLFSFQMFKFISYETVYLHCEVNLCNKKTTFCAPVCAHRESRSAPVTGQILTLGPFHQAVSDTTCEDDCDISTTEEPDLVTNVSDTTCEDDCDISTTEEPDLVTNVSDTTCEDDCDISTTEEPDLVTNESDTSCKDDCDISSTEEPDLVTNATSVVTPFTSNKNTAVSDSPKTTSKANTGKGSYLEVLTVLAVLLSWKIH